MGVAIRSNTLKRLLPVDLQAVRGTGTESHDGLIILLYLMPHG